MGEIRPVSETDIPAVAGMFERILRENNGPATPALETYLKAIFLDAPDFDPELASKVHVRDDGRFGCRGKHRRALRHVAHPGGGNNIAHL